MATEKKTKKEKKVKELKIREIVEMNNVLKKVNLVKLDKDTQITILLVGELLRPHAQAFEEFQKTSIERLKPENFEELEEKQGHLDSLPDSERVAVAAAIAAYNRSVYTALEAQLDKTVTLEYDDIKPIEIKALAEIGSNNAIPVPDLLTIRKPTL